MNPIDLSVVLQTVLAAAVLWLARTSLKSAETLIRIETELRGLRREYDVGAISHKETKDRVYDIANNVHSLMGYKEITNLRLDRLEEASGLASEQRLHGRMAP